MMSETVHSPFSRSRRTAAPLRSSLLQAASGETVDVEYTPHRPGEFTIEFGAGPRLQQLLARLLIRVKRNG
jgi:hypothetical protein